MRSESGGVFLTVEGGEGAGKTTCISCIKETLSENGIDAIFTREPGGTIIGEDIRKILLDPEYTGMAADTELLLMFAARAEHINRVIKPALAAGKWVVSDRFTDATYAYQGAGRGVSQERISIIENFIQGDLRPYKTLLLDIPVAAGMKRVEERGHKDRFEKEKVDFFEDVRKLYLQRANNDVDRFIIIDATEDIKMVQSRIKQSITSIISEQ
ncbi:MAG: dTMP kinase [Gammaproteobacteria bacterium]|nr:MAG: dTMP kinase [Gammaproteobacteria bacterium]